MVITILLELWNWVGRNVPEIIALSTVLFIAYQAFLTRRHNRLSVKSHLTSFVERKRQLKEAILKVRLMNNGLGPALIKTFSVLFDEKPVDGEWQTSAKKILDDYFIPDKYNFQSLTLAKNYAMSEKESRDFLTIHFPCDSDEELVGAEEYLKGIDLVIHYESLYGDKFVFDSRDEESPGHERKLNGKGS